MSYVQIGVEHYSEGALLAYIYNYTVKIKLNEIIFHQMKFQISATRRISSQNGHAPAGLSCGCTVAKPEPVAAVIARLQPLG